jgi:large subunit ribosomal protein L24
MSKWIRKGDQVKVITGNDKGKTGEVLGRDEDRVLVKGVNIRKKHLKRTQQSQGARIVEMEVPIHVSNVAICDSKGEVLKVKVRQEKNGQRELVYKAGAKETVYRAVKKPA